MSTLYDSLVSILGTYQPVTTLQPDNSITTDINWAYIFACIILCIVIWSVLRIIGGVICGKLHK